MAFQRDQPPQTVHGFLYRDHEEIRNAAEKSDSTLRQALEEVLPAIWLFANWVEELEVYQPRSDQWHQIRGKRWVRRDTEWSMTKDLRAHRGKKIVYALIRALRRTLIGELTGPQLMGVAADTREKLKAELLVVDSWVRRLDDRRPELKHPDFLDSYVWTWDRGAQQWVSRESNKLKGYYEKIDGPEPGSDAEFRQLFGRRPGRPRRKITVDDVVFETVHKQPGITVNKLIGATKMKAADVTVAYKRLLAAGRLDKQDGPRRSVRLFPKPRPKG